MEDGDRRMYHSDMQRKQPQSVSQTSHTVIVNYCKMKMWSLVKKI